MIYSYRVYVKWSLVNYKPAYFIIWFSFNINFRFSIKWYCRAQKVICINMWSTPAVWKQYNKMAVLHFFLVDAPLIYILFSLVLRNKSNYICTWRDKCFAGADVNWRAIVALQVIWNYALSQIDSSTIDDNVEFVHS